MWLDRVSNPYLWLFSQMRYRLRYAARQVLVSWLCLDRNTIPTQPIQQSDKRIVVAIRICGENI